MATRQNFSDRYNSVEQLAVDVRKFIAGFPVLAAPRSPLYVLRKFVRRQKFAALLCVALLIGAAGITASHVRETAARRTASQAEKKATAVAQFLHSVLTPQPRFANGSDTTLQGILAYADQYLQNVPDDDTKAAIMQNLGNIHRYHGHFERARDYLASSISLYERELGPNHRSTLQAICDQVRVLHQLGEVEKATATTAALEKRISTHYKNNRALVAQVWFLKGLRSYKLFAYHTARTFFKNALRELRSSPDPDPEQVAETLNYLVYSDQDGSADPADTLAYLAEATEIFRNLPNKEAELGACLCDHAHILNSKGEYEEAEVKARECIEVLERALPNEHMSLVGAKGHLAYILISRKKFDDAEDLLHECVAASLRNFGEGHRETLLAQYSLAYVLYLKGEYSAANVVYTDAIAAARTSSTEASVSLALHLEGLAQVLYILEDYDGADRLFAEALDIKRSKMAPNSTQIARTLHASSWVFLERGEFARAEACLREALEIDKKGGRSSPSSRRHSLTFGMLLSREGRHEEAEATLRRVLHEQELHGKRDDFDAGIAELALAELLCATGRAAEGTRLAQDGLAELQEGWSARHWKIADALRVQGECLSELGDFESALVALTNAYDNLRLAKPANPGRTRQALESLIQFHKTHGDKSTVSRLEAELRDFPVNSLHLLE